MASSSRPKKPVHNVHNGVGQLRIIGGEWGSRKLSFPDVVGLRPTPDRVRETLFNWLAPYIGGAKVLDPFAGSGALFLEALSRGAAQGQALDASNVAVSSLKEHLGTLRCTTGQVQTADALRYLETQAATEYDVVFPRPTVQPEPAASCPARCWKNASGWHRMPGSTLRARPRPPRWACPVAGACTGSRSPGGCITRCGIAPCRSELAREGQTGDTGCLTAPRYR